MCLYKTLLLRAYVSSHTATTRVDTSHEAHNEARVLDKLSGVSGPGGDLGGSGHSQAVRPTSTPIVFIPEVTTI
jgi:hypothetical protein